MDECWATRNAYEKNATKWILDFTVSIFRSPWKPNELYIIIV